jgi:hypothetical protein
VLAAQVMSSVCVCMALEVLGEVHLWLISVVSSVAIEQGVILSVGAVVEHGVGAVVSWRIGAGRAVRGWRIDIGLEETAGVTDRRAVAVLGVQVPVVLVLVEILAAGLEPVETICHHRAAKSSRERLSSAGVRGLLRVCVGWWVTRVSGGRRFWPAKSSSLVHEHQPRSA